MNKAELVAKVTEKTGMSKTAANDAVNAVFESVKEGLKKDGDKYIHIGFGTFSVVKRPARTGINPMTKKAIKIKAKNVVRFKPSKSII